MDKIIDLRSDTLTKPTEAMYRAMREAELGDEQNCEDPTVCRLQDIAAEKLGKEAGLFVTSGTMGNLVAVLTHTKPGDSVVLESESHICRTEAGGISAIAGAFPKVVKGKYGVPSPEDIESSIIGEGRLFPTTTLICLENTHNAAGGTCISAEVMQQIRAVANKSSVKIHVDGARIFNAASALHISPIELVKNADSVQLCLSKSLCAPFGSVLVGSREFIDRARKKRQMVGGGMRQAGIMAAAGIVALEQMVDRLPDDHANAKRLAEGLLNLGFLVDMQTVQTNIVFFEVPVSKLSPQDFVAMLRKMGVLLGTPRGRRIRVVAHKDVSQDDIEIALGKMKQAAG